MSLASQLTERVSIQQRVENDDGYGGKTVLWVELVSVFAKVEPVYTSDDEHTVADQLTARSGYRITLRNRTDIKASMRIVWKTHTLAIHSLHEAEDSVSILTYEENL